jgi:hypothetical protein
MDQSTIIATVAMISSVSTVVFGALNHKRIRSNCCGRLTVSSIDVENTTPPLSSRRASTLNYPPPPPMLSPPPLEIRVPEDV